MRPTTRSLLAVSLLLILLSAGGVFNTLYAAPFSVQVNFQNAAAPVPTNYVRDFGQPYGARTDANQGSGLTYGWVMPGTTTPLDLSVGGNTPGNGRDRGSNGDQLLDTLMHMQPESIDGNFNGTKQDGSWEIAVPNGNYQVTVTAGDANIGSDPEVHTINVEGVNAIDGFLPSGAAGANTRHTTATVSVQVSDGRLTIDANGGTNSKINYAIITGIEGTLRPYVLGSTPADGATGVSTAIGTSITTSGIMLPNGAIDGDTVNADNVYLHPTTNPNARVASSSINSTGGGDAITFVVGEELQANTNYTFVITDGVQDVSGSAFMPFSITFTTGGDTVITPGDITFNNTPTGVDTRGYTSVDIGPDGRLYATTDGGVIYRWDVAADGSLSNEFAINAVNEQTQVAIGPYGGRIAIGLEFDPTSTAQNPILWVSHNYGTFNNGPHFTGAIARLTVTGLGTQNETWTSKDMIVGLPRSAKDHLTNSLEFGPDGALYFTQGSINAMGDIDSPWGREPETILSAAVLRIDPAKLLDGRTLPIDVATGIATGTPNSSTTELQPQNNVPLGDPRLDSQYYNPQASDAPLTLFATGVRNAYDLVWHSNGQLYVPTNGSAGGSARIPDVPSAADASSLIQCQNRIDGVWTGANATINSNAPVTQEDYLYRVQAGKYYGHPNPSRCEWVLNGGNPTSGDDPGELGNHYGVGTQPDRNWGGIAYNFQKNKSPNGVIEYQSEVFGGTLKGSLLVVRYSRNDDIIVLTPDGPNGDIGTVKTGITGFGGFTNPLDLTEDLRNGNLYVIEYNKHYQASITLLTPEDDSYNPGEPDIELDQDRLIFSDVQGGAASAPQTVRITNTGGGTLTVNGISFAGGDADQFVVASAPGTPFNLNPGVSADVDVAFAPDSAGVKVATLQVQSNDPDSSIVVTQVRGLGAQGLGGSNEPSLQWVLDTFDFQIETGDDDDSTGILHSTDFAAPLLGSEVSAQQFRAVSNTLPVVIDVLAAYGPNTNPVTEIGWYVSGSPGTLSPVLSVDHNNSQTLNPAVTGSTDFDPGDNVFSFYSMWPHFNNRVVYGEDSYNTWESSNRRHKIRAFPLEDATGVIENAYVIALEEHTSGFDYNDVVFIAYNVVPALPTSGDLRLENRDWQLPAGVDAAYFEHFQTIMTLTDIPENADNGGLHKETAVLRLNNDSGSEPLTVTNLSFSGVDANSFALVNPPTLPLVINPNGSYDLTIEFVATGNGSGAGTDVHHAQLNVSSTDGDSPISTMKLGGWWQNKSEGGQEPDIDEIAEVFGFTTIMLNNGQQLSKGSFVPAGEEVISSYWRRADENAPIYVRQLAAYHGCCDFEAGGAANLWLHTTPGTSEANGGSLQWLMLNNAEYGQSLLPETGWNYNNNDRTEVVYTPTVEVFGFKNENEYTDHMLHPVKMERETCANNDRSACGHHIRFWPARDASGAIIPNAWIMGTDYNSINFDYNDNMYYITNIQPETTMVDLAIEMDPIPAEMAVNNPLTYDLTVINTSTFSADDVAVSYDLPANTTYVNATADQGTCAENAGTLTCSLGTVDGENSVNIAVTVEPTATGQLTSTFDVATTSTDTVGTNNSVSATIDVLLTTNTSPVVTNPGDQTNVLGDVVSLQIEAIDTDNLSYSATGLPGGLSINPTSGVIAGTIDAAGTFNTVVTVTDDGDQNLSTDAAFTWTVTDPTDSCSPLSPDGCDTIPTVIVSDFCLGWDADEGGLADANGIGTGFTMVDPPSARLASDGPISNPDVPGYEPSRLDVSGGYLTITSNNGIAYLKPSGPGSTSSNTNSQINTLGVGFDADLASYTVSTQIDDLDFTVSSGNNSQQAGLWFGLDEDNFVKLVAVKFSGNQMRIELRREIGSNSVQSDQVITGGLGAPGDDVTLAMILDPVNNTVQATYAINDGDPVVLNQTPMTLPANFFSGVTLPYDSGVTSFAGIFATHRRANTNQVITPAFDYFCITPNGEVPNQAPVITAPADQTNNVGEAVSLQLEASDIEGDTLTYGAANLPDGLTIDAASGLISGTIAEGAEANSPYTVTVSVSDGDLTDDASFTWTVIQPNRAPVLTAPADQTNDVGDEISLQVEATDADADALTHSATDLPDGLTIDAASGLISGTIAEGAEANSPYTVTVSVSDGDLTDEVSFTWTVIQPNRAPVLTAPADQTNNVGDEISLQVEATDADADALTYSAANLPDGLTIDAASGLISGTIAEGTKAASPYTVTITVGDGDLTDEVSFTWTIENAAPVIVDPLDQVNEINETVSLQIEATDNDGDALTYGATGLPTGLTIDAASGLISGTLTTADVYSVTVSVSDGDLSDDVTFNWTVTDPAAENVAPVLTAPANQTSTVGEAVSLQLAATDANGDILTFSATGLPTGLNVNPTSGLINGTPTTAGSYNVTVSVSDGDLSDDASFTWVVNEQTIDNTAPVLTAPANQTSTVGEAVSLQLAATDADGDTLTFSATGLPAGLSVNAASGLIAGTPTSAGTYSVTVSVSDGMLNDSAIFTWVVNEAPVSGGLERIYPADGETVTSAAQWPRFQFTEKPGAHWYQVWIGTLDGRSMLFDWYPASASSEQNTTGTGICENGICTVPEDLWLRNGQYQWYITYWSPTETSFQEYWQRSTFNINVAAPGPINRSAPQGNLGSSPATLEWQHDQGVLWYHIWLGPNDYSRSDLYEWYRADQICTNGLCSVNVPTLAAGSYEWWIETWGPNTYTDWMANGPMAFSIGLPSLPTSLNTTMATAPTFQWAADANATHYELVISTEDYTVLYSEWFEAAACVGGGTCTVNDAAIDALLTPGTTYHFFVRAYGNAGFSTGGVSDSGYAMGTFVR